MMNAHARRNGPGLPPLWHIFRDPSRICGAHAWLIPVREQARTGSQFKGFALRNVYRRLPQKRWMRLQASSRSDVLVAYEIRNAGPSPNADPCTTATPSVSSNSVTKSWSLSMTLPDGEVLPMVPAQDG